MKNRILFYLIGFLFVIGCDNGDDTVNGNTKLASVTVEEQYNGGYHTNYIMLHDASGALLASRSFSGNEEFVLETDKVLSGNTISVTLLKIQRAQGEDYYFLDSYLNIETGKNILLKPENAVTSSPALGQFDIKISGIDNPDQFTLASGVGAAYSSVGSNNSLALTGWVGSLPNDFIFQLTDLNGNLKHKIFTNVKPNDLYSFSLDELTDFDKSFEFKFPSSSKVDLVVTGRRGDKTFQDIGYRVNQHKRNDTHSSIKAGYLNSLSKYETFLTVGYPDFDFVYSNVGSIPSGNINWPSQSAFNVSKKDLNNFSANATVSFAWRTSAWQYKDGQNPYKRIVWNVTGSSGEHHILDLPAELTTSHPLLVLDNMEYVSTTFYTLAESYSTYIDKILKSERGPFEPSVGITIYDR